VIAYRATLDVPRELAQFVAKLLAAERRRRGTPRGSRALTCFGQAVLGVRWFRDRTTPGALARIHALPALYRAAADLPTLADLGYDGAGIGILIPVKQPTGAQDLAINTRTRNAIQRSLRCLGERGFALLNQRWRTLQHITASPSKIGDIARAALVLTHFEHGYIT
jgi:DDE superfamily endonuclease